MLEASVLTGEGGQVGLNGLDVGKRGFRQGWRAAWRGHPAGVAEGKGGLDTRNLSRNTVDKLFYIFII
jgi:hypothetical protein